MNKLKLINIYVFMIVTAFLGVLYALLLSGTDTDAFEHNDVRMADKGFCYVASDNKKVNVETSVAMPGKLDGITGNTYELTYLINSNYTEGKSFVIETVQQQLEVYIEDKLIYSFGDNSSMFVKGSGSSMHYIEILPEYFGKNIKFRFTTPYNKRFGQLNSIYIGNATDITIYLLKEGAFSFICSLMLFAMGIFLIILWLFLRVNKQGKALLYLGEFSILMALFSISTIDFVEIFISNTQIAKIAVYEILMIIAIPMAMYFREVYSKKWRKYYDIQIICSAVIFVIEHVLLFMGIQDLSESIKLSYIPMIFSLIVSSIISIIAGGKNAEKNGRATKLGYLRYGLILIVGTIVIDIFNYFYSWYTDAAMCSRFGLMLYITIIAIDTLANVYDMMFKGKKAQMLKEIAHEDVLTKTHSRTAYEEEMNTLSGNVELCIRAAIVSLDVNDLKVMNDSFGHEAGDKYLLDCANAITSSFRGFGECYRTGGDEFMVIIKDFNAKKFEEKINNMKKAVEKRQIETSRPMSMAYGYAVFNDVLDYDIYSTAKRADVLMYKAKNEGKERKRKAEEEYAREHNITLELSDREKAREKLIESMESNNETIIPIEPAVPVDNVIQEQPAMPVDNVIQEQIAMPVDNVIQEQPVIIPIQDEEKIDIDVSSEQANQYILEAISKIGTNPYISKDETTSEMYRKNQMNTLENQYKFCEQLKEYEEEHNLHNTDSNTFIDY